MISVVIPSYNRRDCVLALLGDVCRQEGVEFEIIVVDDCSSDGSVASVRREFPSVQLLVNDANAGPSVARNRGILAAKGEWIVGFDSDVTLPDPRLLAGIAARFEVRADVAGLALRILKADGKSEDVDRWWHPQPLRTHVSRAFFTTYFSGTAYAFRRSAVLRAGLYPEILYMHYEEVELAWRILDDGGRILYEPDLAVVHHAHPVSRRSQVDVFLKPRNQILLAASCLPWSAAARYAVPRTAYQAFRACRRGHFLDFVRAMTSAARLLPRQLERRKPIRRSTLRTIRRLKDAAKANAYDHSGRA